MKETLEKVWQNWNLTFSDQEPFQHFHYYFSESADINTRSNCACSLLFCLVCDCLTVQSVVMITISL